MANNKTNKPTLSAARSKVKKSRVYDCDKVEAYLDLAIEKVHKEVLPLISALDKRDADQYDTAKKIIIDLTAAANHRQEAIEASVSKLGQTVETVRTEIEGVFESRKAMVAQLTSSFQAVQDKLDSTVTEQSSEFKKLHEGLTLAATHVATLQTTLDNVRVNGGTYPLSEAMKHIYDQQMSNSRKLDDNALKLKELALLVEPIQARIRWSQATRDLVNKNGLMHFALRTRTGRTISIILLLLLVNTIVVDVFHTQFDLMSIIRWVISKGQ